MSGPTKGGVTVKVLSGRTAASLQRYRDAKEDKEPALFMATRHCSMDAETQIAQWKAVRVEHGTQGRTRAARGKYETVDPDTDLHANGQRGTHVKFWDGKRYRKRLAGPNETPTHLYVAPEDLTPEKESEATHTIYAFGADMVNPENPEDVERAFLAVKAERDEHYPGLQESMWGERNGESGLFHVHVASNATVYREFTLDGVDYRAGQKMGGDMRDVHRVRARFEQYLDAHPEYGFEQSLARVGTKEYEAAQRRDGQHAYWEAERAAREGRAPKETNQDRIRREAYEALQEPGVTDRASFVDEMQRRGIAVEETGLRRGKRGKGYDLRYRVHGAKQGVKGATLGPEYAHDAIDAQLARRATGLDVEMPAGKQQVGEAKPLPLTSEHLSAEEQAELDELKASVDRLAQEERARQQEEWQQAEHEADPQKPTRPTFAELLAQAEAKSQNPASSTVAEDEPQQPAVDVTSQLSPEQPGNDGPQPHPPEPKPEPAAPRSRIKDLTSTSAGMQERYTKLGPFEERWAGKLPSTPEERLRFEQEASKIGIGRRVLRDTQGVMDPELHEYLTQRVEHAEHGARAVARKKELDLKIERLEGVARSDPFDLRGTAKPLRSAKADRRFEDGYIDRVRADHAVGVYTSREHERTEWAKERLSREVDALNHGDPDQPEAGRAPEKVLTPAQQRVREIKARQKDAAKARKERSQDQGYDMGM